MNTQTFATALLDQGTPSGLKTWNGSAPETRFAVYRNNVLASLLNALADSFPVTRELVGDEFFRYLGREFIRQHPPRSPQLMRYGIEPSLAEFIAGFEPADCVPYLSDIATLEAARIVAYHSADTAALTSEELSTLLTRDIDHVRLRLHPSVQVIASSFAIASLWSAHQGVLEIQSVNPLVAEQVLILRDDMNVLVLFTALGDASFFSSLLRGDTLGDAVATAEQHTDFNLTNAMQTLIRRRVITGILTE